MNTHRMLLMMDQLNKGIIPVCGFHPKDIEKFVKSIESLSCEERRMATRKFRKIFKKAVKAEIIEINANEVIRPEHKIEKIKALHLRLGSGSIKPTSTQKKFRRRFVSDYIRYQFGEFV